MNQNIVSCGHKVNIDTHVVLWNNGFVCPNKRGRSTCSYHDPKLNDAPSRKNTAYKILNPESAYKELAQRVHQLVLHYDACYSSFHCHQLMTKSSFKGSHFYLDLDGTLYQISKLALFEGSSMLEPALLGALCCEAHIFRGLRYYRTFFFQYGSSAFLY